MTIIIIIIKSTRDETVKGAARRPAEGRPAGGRDHLQPLEGQTHKTIKHKTRQINNKQVISFLFICYFFLNKNNNKQQRNKMRY